MTRKQQNRYKRQWSRRRNRRLRELGLNKYGKPRKYRDWSILDYSNLHGDARERRREHIVRMERQAQGLTMAGTPRQQRQWPKLKGLSHREANKIRSRTYRKERIAKGLTARGTPRLDRRKRSTLEISWEQLRNTMIVPPTPEILTVAERNELCLGT